MKIYFSLHTKYTTDQNVRVPPVLVLHYARNEVLVIYEIELMVRLENLYCARNLKLYASMCAPSWKQAL